MSFLQQILDGKTEKDDQGRTIVFPWGVFGSGFPLIGEAQLTEYRSLRKMAVLLSIPAAVVAIMFGSAWVALGCIVVIQVWYGWRIGNIKMLSEDHYGSS